MKEFGRTEAPHIPGFPGIKLQRIPCCNKYRSNQHREEAKNDEIPIKFDREEEEKHTAKIKKKIEDKGKFSEYITRVFPCNNGSFGHLHEDLNSIFFQDKDDIYKSKKAFVRKGTIQNLNYPSFLEAFIDCVIHQQTGIVDKNQGKINFVKMIIDTIKYSKDNFYYLADGKCINYFKKSFLDIQDNEWQQFMELTKNIKIFKKLNLVLKSGDYKNSFKTFFDSIETIKLQKDFLCEFEYEMAKINYINYLQEKNEFVDDFFVIPLLNFIFPNFIIVVFENVNGRIQVKNNMENLPIYDNDIHTFLFIYKEGEIYEPIIYLDLSTKSISRYTDFTYNNLIKYLETDFTNFFYNKISEESEILSFPIYDESLDTIFSKKIISKPNCHFLIDNDNKINFIVEEQATKIKILPINLSNDKIKSYDIPIKNIFPDNIFFTQAEKIISVINKNLKKDYNIRKFCEENNIKDFCNILGVSVIENNKKQYIKNIIIQTLGNKISYIPVKPTEYEGQYEILFHYDLEDVDNSLFIEKSLHKDDRLAYIFYENLKQDITNKIHNKLYDNIQEDKIVIKKKIKTEESLVIDAYQKFIFTDKTSITKQKNNKYIDYDIYGKILSYKNLDETYNEVTIEISLLDDLFSSLKSYYTNYSKKRILFDNQKLQKIYSDIISDKELFQGIPLDKLEDLQQTILIKFIDLIVINNITTNEQMEEMLLEKIDLTKLYYCEKPNDYFFTKSQYLNDILYEKIFKFKSKYVTYYETPFDTKMIMTTIKGISNSIKNFL